MKVVLNVLVLLSITSCAGYATRTYKQKCASKGMVLSGVTSQSGGTSGSAYSYQTNTTVNTYGSYSGEAVSCEVPRTPVDKCRVVEIERSTAPVYEYNEWSGTKDFATGLGYAAFFVPGVVMKLAFENQISKAETESAKLEAEAENKCEEYGRQLASQK
jgi:hypothetical protein